MENLMVQDLSLDQHLNRVVLSCLISLGINLNQVCCVPAEMEMIVRVFISSRPDYRNSLFIVWVELLWTAYRWSRMQLPGCWQNHSEPCMVICQRSAAARSEPQDSELRDLLQPDQNHRTLSSSDQGLLVVPPSRIRTKGDAAFQVSAPKLWTEAVWALWTFLKSS